jgi:peptidoglycan/xylan/chitin deacetylase (PgdA/CDA1 family)
MLGGKRELLAAGLRWSGMSSLLGALPARDALLVLNYHRIGDAGADPFDPDLFSATTDELDRQISYLKRRLTLVTLQEAQAFADGSLSDNPARTRALITFDDGYLDNYELAFPILRSHGVQGVFFLATNIVGSCLVPWWDRIAYVMKTARRRLFTLRYPAELTVDIDRNGMTKSLRDVLDLYKTPATGDPELFLRNLEEQTKGDAPPATLRRFIDWKEAREMIRGGMAIGSHTHSHDVLSQLAPPDQRRELTRSREILQEQLGVAIDSFAYPVGRKTAFTDQTQSIAREAGYRTAFSYYGGVNFPGQTNPRDVRRVGVGGQSWTRFRVQAAVCRATGSYFP